MNAPLTIIDLDALYDAPLGEKPFPYVVVNEFLRPEFAHNICRDFPEIKSRGSYPLQELEYGEAFQQLVEELESPALKAVIAEKFQMDLDDRFTLITVRAIANAGDGRIHTDTKSKYLTMLLYLNPAWDAEGGRLRLLRNDKDLEDYVVEIPPTFGTCVLFRVTENCWHGHKSFNGPRKVLQLNYVKDEAALNRSVRRHRLSAKLKAILQPFRSMD
ncbi:MAG: hypothetical protein QOD75_2698 [Blastocatellia bacterium]|jgi:hypothetical protein|nr:hypothetical protein [Blastocatellia bacterium]